MTIQTDEIVLSKGFCIPAFESDTDVTVGDGKVAFTVPAFMDGMNLTDVIASVHTPGSGSGTVDIQIRRRRSGSDVDVLSTKITIGTGEYNASDGVVNTSNDDLQTGDQLYGDVDATTSTAPKGLSITPVARKP